MARPVPAQFPTRSRGARLASRALVALLFAAQALHAQQSTVAQQIAADRALLAKESYVTPPPEIAKLVTAPRYLNVALTAPSPDRTRFLDLEGDGMGDLNAFGKFHYYFGGLQVDPKANRARPLTTRASAGLSIVDGHDGQADGCQLPKGATASAPVWSPDGKQVAYIANFDDGSYVYVADAATGKSVQASKTPLLATLVTTLDWTDDGSGVVAVFVPDARGRRSRRGRQWPRGRWCASGWTASSRRSATSRACSTSRSTRT